MIEWRQSVSLKKNASCIGRLMVVEQRHAKFLAVPHNVRFRFNRFLKKRNALAKARLEPEGATKCIGNIGAAIALRAPQQGFGSGRVVEAHSKLSFRQQQIGRIANPLACSAVRFQIANILTHRIGQTVVFVMRWEEVRRDLNASLVRRQRRGLLAGCGERIAERVMCFKPLRAQLGRRL